MICPFCGSPGVSNTRQVFGTGMPGTSTNPSVVPGRDAVVTGSTKTPLCLPSGAASSTFGFVCLNQSPQRIEHGALSCILHADNVTVCIAHDLSSQIDHQPLYAHHCLAADEMHSLGKRQLRLFQSGPDPNLNTIRSLITLTPSSIAPRASFWRFSSI